MPILTSGKYKYKITLEDLKLEQTAFEPEKGYVYSSASVLCLVYIYMHTL